MMLNRMTQCQIKSNIKMVVLRLWALVLELVDLLVWQHMVARVVVVVVVKYDTLMFVVCAVHHVCKVLVQQ